MRGYRYILSSAVAIGLALLAWSGGCSPDNPLTLDESADLSARVDCGELTYQNFAADFFATYCLGCHNEQIQGDLARTDAPNGINFNRLDGIRTFQRRIRLRAGEQGDMPPALLPLPRPTEEERRMLIQWIDCGTPSGSESAAQNSGP